MTRETIKEQAELLGINVVVKRLLAMFVIKKQVIKKTMKVIDIVNLARSYSKYMFYNKSIGQVLICLMLSYFFI